MHTEYFKETFNTSNAPVTHSGDESELGVWDWRESYICFPPGQIQYTFKTNNCFRISVLCSEYVLTPRGEFWAHKLHAESYDSQATLGDFHSRHRPWSSSQWLLLILHEQGSMQRTCLVEGRKTSACFIHRLPGKKLQKETHKARFSHSFYVCMYTISQWNVGTV